MYICEYYYVNLNMYEFEPCMNLNLYEFEFKIFKYSCNMYLLNGAD
jgi:hypothetical protein